MRSAPDRFDLARYSHAVLRSRSTSPRIAEINSSFVFVAADRRLFEREEMGTDAVAVGTSAKIQLVHQRNAHFHTVSDRREPNSSIVFRPVLAALAGGLGVLYGNDQSTPFNVIHSSNS